MSYQAYADDQNKLDTIINLIKTTDANQTSARKHSWLDSQESTAEQRIEELTLYINAEPDSALTTTRETNVRRLALLIRDVKRRKTELNRVEAVERRRLANETNAQ